MDTVIGLGRGRVKVQIVILRCVAPERGINPHAYFLVVGTHNKIIRFSDTRPE